MEIVPGKHAEVDVQAARKIGETPPFPDMVGGRRRAVLHQVVPEPIFPDHFTVTVYLHDDIHLGAFVAVNGIGVGAQRDDFIVRQIFVGNVENGVVLQFRVVDAQKIMVRVVSLTAIGMLPQDVAFPVHLRKGRRPPGAEHRTVFEQIGVGESGPVVHHLPRHVDQVDACDSGQPGPYEGIARIRLLRIPVDQFGRSS